MSKYITIDTSTVFTLRIHEPVAQRRCDGHVQNDLGQLIREYDLFRNNKLLLMNLTNNTNYIHYDIFWHIRRLSEVAQ